MANTPSYEALQAEILHLKTELQAYQDSSADKLRQSRQHWQGIVLLEDLNVHHIIQILAELAGHIGARTAVLYDYDPLGKIFNQVHCFPIVDDALSENDEASYEDYPFITEQMLMGNKLIINNLDDFPPDCPDKQHLIDAHQSNLLAIPIMHDGVLLGSLDIHNGKDAKTWTQQDIQLASLAAPILYQGYQKLQNHQFEQWLNNSNHLLSKVADISTLEFCMQGLCRIIDIDGVDLLIPNAGMSEGYVVCTYPSTPESRLAQKPINLSAFPWTTEQIENNQLVAINDIDDLPDEAKQDQALLRQDKYYSFLIVPLAHGGQVSALLDLYTVGRKHRWTSREIKYVKQILPLLYTAYEQLQLQRTRKESLTTLQLVLETTNVGYGIVNRDLSEYFFSESTATMMGYPKTLKVTTDWIISHLLWDDDVRESDQCYREGAFIDKKTQCGIIKVRSVSNTPQWLWASYAPNSYDSVGNVTTILVGYSDITTQIEKQDALEASRLEADAANTAKSEFLARMSHEIRTPMNAIIGMTHLIQDTQLDEQQAEQIGHVDQAAQNLLAIINDILDFSKIESGKLELESTDFELPALLDQVIHVASFHGKSHQQELILDVDSSVPQRLKGDPLRITQILTNLLSNAVKFTPKGNVYLKVNAHQQGTNTALNFTIKDHGIGMTDEQLSHLFQPFTQADGTISREYGGTGLGLSIVKRLIELMGSNIHVISKLGEGTTFTFSLNLQEADHGNEKNLELNKLRTLIVDDNHEARQVIANIAKSLKLPTKEASSAKQAIELIHQYNQDPSQCFELVLMDYRMPEIDGLHAAEIIKHDQKLKHIPTVIMVSACDREEVMKNQLSQYLEGFLSKPVSASRLYNSVNHLLYKVTETLADTTPYDTHLSGLKVLLVEDNIVNQKVAKGILAKQGIITSIANNGQEAIDMLMDEQHGFEIILMDIEMPKVDGYQATSFIRKQLNLDTPIIAMTAHAMSSDRKKCLAAGMNDHIHKPIQPDVLYETLASYSPKQSAT